jgi:DNA ligase 4
MPFLFSHVCDLLQRLEDNQAGAHSRSRSGPLRTSADIIREWFAAHRAQINRDDHNATALLSTLLPEKRSDRVYCLRERRLCAAIGRGLVLGRTRIHQLGRWDWPGSDVDLAECVESILKGTVSFRFPLCRSGAGPGG